MNLRTFLELGRTSNIPTVWTNVLCGAVIGSGAPLTGGQWPSVLLVTAAGCAFYLGGMLLNDAFDADWDRRHGKARPIVTGKVARREVFTVGFALLGVGLAASLVVALLGAGWPLCAAALCTSAAVVAYDYWHKVISWAPLLMGACRAGLYAMGATAIVGIPSANLWTVAAAACAYVVGLTHIARFETGTTVSRLWVGLLVFAPALWASFQLATGTPTIAHFVPAGCLALQIGWCWRALTIVRSGRAGAIPKAVVSLIAGLCLVDATWLAFVSSPLALVAIVAFGLTLRWQRTIAGT